MKPVNSKEQAVAAAKAINGSAIPNLTAGEPAPLYEKVKRHMSEAILVGEWAPGAVLPSETALSQMFGVAVGTVRRAMSDLVAEGLLSRRRKTGTVVTGRSPHHTMRFFFQYFRLHGRDGEMVRSRAKMLSCALGEASDIEAERRAIAPVAPVLRLHRVRAVDGKPVMHDRLVLAAERVPDFPQALADIPELLYLFLVERYGIRISVVREELGAELATEEDCALLDLAQPAAVLAISDISFDQAGVPTILSTHRATTEAHFYVNEIR